MCNDEGKTYLYKINGELIGEFSYVNYLGTYLFAGLNSSKYRIFLDDKYIDVDNIYNINIYFA